MSDGETSIWTGSNYREAVSTLHVALENGSDLHVIECQKIRHNRGRSTELAICSICEKQVVDDSETEDGDDAVFCDGECQCWLHRTCVCLPKSEFAKLKSEEPFHCPRCSSNMQMKIICELREAV